MKPLVILAIILPCLLVAPNHSHAEENQAEAPQTLSEALAKLAEAKKENARVTAELEQAKNAVKELLEFWERDTKAKIAEIKKFNGFRESFDPLSVEDMVDQIKSLETIVMKLSKENETLRQKLNRPAQ